MAWTIKGPGVDRVPLTFPVQWAPHGHFSKRSSAWSQAQCVTGRCLNSQLRRTAVCAGYLLAANSAIRRQARGRCWRPAERRGDAETPAATHALCSPRLCLPAAELTGCWCFMFIILSPEKRLQRLVCSFGVLSVVFCNNWDFHKE